MYSVVSCMKKGNKITKYGVSDGKIVRYMTESEVCTALQKGVRIENIYLRKDKAVLKNKYGVYMYKDVFPVKVVYTSMDNTIEAIDSFF